MAIRLIAVSIVLSCAALAAADEPGKFEPRPHAEFKDLTPPKLPEPGGHGGGHGAPAGCPAGCEVVNHSEGAFFGTAEYLLLRPRRNALDFAISDPNRDLIPSGKLESLNYELRSGVRAGLGYRLADSFWDVKFEYTYLVSGADRSIAAPPGGTLYATLTRPGLNDEANFANASCGLEYNVFDTVAARRIILDEHTALRLYAGFRFAAIRQNFQSIYDGGDANQGLVQTRTNFDGFGPLVGGESTWQLHGGFHLYARGSAALVTGRVNNPITETNNAGQTVYANVTYPDRRVVPVIGLGIGGGWQYENVSFRAGYEITNWFNLIDTPRFSGELAEGKYGVRNGDLSLEGLFVQLGLAF